jgi:hypothetical protein
MAVTAPGILLQGALPETAIVAFVYVELPTHQIVCFHERPQWYDRQARTSVSQEHLKPGEPKPQVPAGRPSEGITSRSEEQDAFMCVAQHCQRGERQGALMRAHGHAAVGGRESRSPRHRTVRLNELQTAVARSLARECEPPKTVPERLARLMDRLSGPDNDNRRR